MSNHTYPQNPIEWRAAIRDGIGVNAIKGKNALKDGRFPYEKLEQWIRDTYSEGYSTDFVPALLRNIKGLVAWVYGDAGEPFWPRSDDDLH